MPVTQEGINSDTPMGANLTKTGATFRVWAPGATAVYVALNVDATYTPAAGDLLVKNTTSGHWTGFISGVTEGTAYRYSLRIDPLTCHFGKRSTRIAPLRPRTSCRRTDGL